MKHLFLILCGLAPVVATAAESRLTNVSVRSAAGGDAETLIVGFAIGGTGAKQVLLRGIGPSLTPFGVTGAVVDPRLRLFAGTTAIGENEDWGGDTNFRTTFSAVGAFSLAAASRDAALLQSLQPGAYSVHLVAASGPGIALVECYAAAAVAAVTRWTFVPGRQNGRLVTTHMQVPIIFTLDE